MDSNTALLAHRRRKLTQLSARCKTTEFMSPKDEIRQEKMSAITADDVHDFAYRDEYGRYQAGEEDNGARNVGISGVGAAGALGAGLYARGRMTGAIAPSVAENAVRKGAGSVRRGAADAAGYIGRGARFVKQDAQNVATKAGVIGRNARSSFRGARTEIGNKGAMAAPKVGRKYLRNFLTRTGRGLAKLR